MQREIEPLRIQQQLSIDEQRMGRPGRLNNQSSTSSLTSCGSQATTLVDGFGGREPQSYEQSQSVEGLGDQEQLAWDQEPMGQQQESYGRRQLVSGSQLTRESVSAYEPPHMREWEKQRWGEYMSERNRDRQGPVSEQDKLKWLKELREREEKERRMMEREWRERSLARERGQEIRDQEERERLKRRKRGWWLMKRGGSSSGTVDK
jgi:hypothetical protein